MRQRFNKYERKEHRAYKLEQALAGAGLYIYENPSKTGELTLPRPTASGVRKVGPKGQFQGDNYYMGMVRTNELRLIKEIQSPEEEKNAMQQEKLLLDQPDTIKAKGKVEHVVAKPSVPAKKLNEGSKKAALPPKDVLLTEDPMAGVEIITE